MFGKWHSFLLMNKVNTKLILRYRKIYLVQAYKLKNQRKKEIYTMKINVHFQLSRYNLITCKLIGLFNCCVLTISDQGKNLSENEIFDKCDRHGIYIKQTLR